MMGRRTLWWLGTAVLAAGCGGGARVQTPPPAPVASAQLETAMRLVRRGDFRGAQVAFQRLMFEFGPGQAELPQARYYYAECYFQLGDRVQAAHEFLKVAADFPTSEYAPLALMRAGDANLRLWRRAELDPTSGETALALYQRLAGDYPDSDAAARARVHVRRLQEQFADKTYKTGMFYVRRKAFDSAIIYFKDVIANYPTSSRAPDALLRLVDSYRTIRYRDEERETCAHLRRFYPGAVGLDRTCPAEPTPTPS